MTLTAGRRPYGGRQVPGGFFFTASVAADGGSFGEQIGEQSRFGGQ